MFIESATPSLTFIVPDAGTRRERRSDRGEFVSGRRGDHGGDPARCVIPVLGGGHLCLQQLLKRPARHRRGLAGVVMMVPPMYRKRSN